MRCQSIRDLLSPYIDLVLSEEEKTRVENHLATCESCRRELAELQAVVKNLNGMEKLEAPSGFMSELHERLSREKVVPFNKRDQKNHLISHTAGLFAASAASIALIAGIYISSLVPSPVVANFFDKLPQIIAPKDSGLRQDIERFLKEKEQQMHTALNIRQEDQGNKDADSPGSDKKQNAAQPRQVAVKPGEEPATTNNPSFAKPMLVNTVSLQMEAKDSEQVADDIMQLAAVNEAQVETGASQIMSGASKVLTVRVPPEKVSGLVTGIQSFGCQVEPMQGVQDVSADYNSMKNRLAEVGAEITRLRSEESLDADESDKLSAMILEKSLLEDKIKGLEAKTQMVEVNVMITEEADH